MKKRLCGLILTFIVLLMTAVAPASAQGETGTGHERETDIRLSVAEECRLMQEAGIDLAAWDSAMEEMKQAGLASPISREALLEADENALILEEDGLVYQLGPSPLFGQVADAQEAFRLAYRLAGLFGGTDRTPLYLTLRLTMNETTVYAFQQVCGSEEVLGGTLKIALDENNGVTAVFGWLDPEADQEQTPVTREEAEAAAKAHCAEEGLPTEVLTEYTDRIFQLRVSFAEALNLDKDDDGPTPRTLVWAVYTENGGADAETYPYLAHYILTDGTYLSSLPVRQPGDTEARCGYRQQEVFAGMTADTYTGEITDPSGNVRTVTVPVMRSEADGYWYLGDVERRIVFADFYGLAYGEKHDLVLLRSEDNCDWDSEDIAAFYNYLRVRDFYADMGWNGPDGMDTDELILRGMAYSDGTVYENACSVGNLECWQVFAYSPYGMDGEPLGLTWATDVLAHEYTHTFTSTVMGANLYENDQGAINEAMSDILGNLTEQIFGDTEDTAWLLGENTGMAIRSMIDPEMFAQPASVWGMYYAPKTDAPNANNDHGGVHTNSSLLNLIGAELCREYGMPWEDAVSFWLMTAVGITPKTDYLKMSALLVWAMEESGYAETYGDALQALIDRTRIDRTDLPETLPEGQKLVRIILPDTETFKSENWIMYIQRMELKTPEELTAGIVDSVTRLLEDPESRQSLAEEMEALSAMLNGEANQEPSGEFTYEVISRAKELLFRSETDTYFWEEMDTGVIPFVMDDQPMLYSLANISMGGTRINCYLVLLDGSWVDLTDMFLDIQSDSPTAKESTAELYTFIWKELMRQLPVGLDGKTDAGAEGLRIETLPTEGLESFQLDPEVLELE